MTTFPIAEARWCDLITELEYERVTTADSDCLYCNHLGASRYEAYNKSCKE